MDCWLKMRLNCEAIVINEADLTDWWADKLISGSKCQKVAEGMYGEITKLFNTQMSWVERQAVSFRHTIKYSLGDKVSSGEAERNNRFYKKELRLSQVITQSQNDTQAQNETAPIKPWG